MSTVKVSFPSIIDSLKTKFYEIDCLSQLPLKLSLEKFSDINCLVTKNNNEVYFRSFVSLFVNGDSIYDNKLSLKDNDCVEIVVAISGG